MKISIATLLALSTIIYSHALGNSINPVIGNISFVEKYGFEPYMGINDQERIATHLQYVEETLRTKDVSNLTEELKANRKRLLDHLKDYWQARVFPKNKDHLGRKPCFIDNEGNICAVGYLVEQSAGRETAKTINAIFKYASIYEMKDSEVLQKWIVQSGLTLKEAAMIQPWYSYSISPSYRYSTYSLTALNGVSTSVSVFGNGKSNFGKASPYLGLAAGISQTTVGIVQSRKRLYKTHGWGYDAEVVLHDGFNVGFGLSTTLFNAYSIYNRRRKSINTTSFFSPSTFTLPENELAYGFSFVRRF